MGLPTMSRSDSMLADIIKGRMRELGWNIEVTSERTGLKRQAISDILRQKTVSPRFDTLSKLCKGLGLSMAAFDDLGDTEYGGVREIECIDCGHFMNDGWLLRFELARRCPWCTLDAIDRLLQDPEFVMFEKSQK